MNYPRFCQKSIQESLQDTPITTVVGARQTGKSTLVSGFSASYFTFDDWSTLNSAKLDPEGFIQAALKNPWPIILDEIQHVPELFLSIKKTVDQNRKPGMFLLTGSANLLNWSKLPDSLAGRIEYINLYPLSLAEVVQNRTGWIDQIFAGKIEDSFLHNPTIASLSQVEQIITKGGYPEAFKREQPSRREAWYASYIKSLIERDILTIDTVEKPLNVHRLMIHLAVNVGSLLNFTNLALKLQITLPTIRKYIHLLELLCLCYRLQPWHSNLSKRLVKTPKIYFNDTGILQYLIHLNPETQTGVLMENFIFNELQKQINWSITKPEIYFWRTSNGREIDFILEDKQGRVVGIECKAAATITSSDFSHLKALQQDIPEQFLAGYVIYKGDKVLSFGKNLYAVPITYLF